MLHGKRLTTVLALVVVLIFAAQATAATWQFSWYGWKGGTRDSSTWGARYTGTHTWVKETCRAVNNVSGRYFGVEIRRVRSFQPDVSLGTQRFACTNNDAAARYYSGGGGKHKFRFPYVDRGNLDGIRGTGHVNYPG